MQLHQDLKKKGVVVIGLSREADSKIAKRVKADKTPFIVASGSRSGTVYGIRALPTFFVINLDGNVTYKGHSVDDARVAVLRCLKSAPPGYLEDVAKQREREAADRLKKADDLYKKKLLKDAFEAYTAVANEFDDTPTGKKAEELVDHVKDELIDAESDAALKNADGLFARKNYRQALDAYKKVVALFPKTAGAEKAQAKIDEIKADASIARQMRDAEAAKKCKSWIQLARNFAKSGKVEKARVYYGKVIKQFGDTSWAETAREELAKL